MQSPACPHHDDQPAQAQAVSAITGVAHHEHDLLDRRRISGIAHALVARGLTSAMTGQRGRRPATTRSIQHTTGSVIPPSVDDAAHRSTTPKRCARTDVPPMPPTQGGREQPIKAHPDSSRTSALSAGGRGTEGWDGGSKRPYISRFEPLCATAARTSVAFAQGALSSACGDCSCRPRNQRTVTPRRTRR